jgi:hypothetical protein
MLLDTHVYGGESLFHNLYISQRRISYLIPIGKVQKLHSGVVNIAVVHQVAKHKEGNGPCLNPQVCEGHLPLSIEANRSIILLVQGASEIIT